MSDAETSAKKSADSGEMDRRERYLRLALITIGAALLATAFSIYSQRNDGDPVAAGRATAEATSGVVTIDLEATVDTETSSTAVVTRFADDDYETTITGVGDIDAYASTVAAQEVRSVGGQLYYSSSDDESWQEISDLSPVRLDDGAAMPATIVGWSTTGIDGFLDATNIGDLPDDGAATGSITVGEARALADLPPSVAAVVDERWGWADDQPVAITVAVDGESEVLATLTVEATDTDENGDGTSISAQTVYTELDTDIAIEPPA